MTTKGKVGNPKVRVWKEVYDVYREIAADWGIMLSDLISIVLLYTPLLSPYVVALGLEDNYDIRREEAVELAEELRDRLIEQPWEEIVKRWKGDSA